MEQIRNDSELSSNGYSSVNSLDSLKTAINNQINLAGAKIYTGSINYNSSINVGFVPKYIMINGFYYSSAFRGQNAIGYFDDVENNILYQYYYEGTYNSLNYYGTPSTLTASNYITISGTTVTFGFGAYNNSLQCLIVG